MAALGFFLTRHLLCQVPERHRSNKTLLMLSSIVKEILSQNDQEKSKKSGTLYQLNQAKRLLEEILEEAESQGENSSKKTKKYALEGVLSIEQVEKDLEE
ncbi:hypothetical protein G6F57_009589 [Rhizopus arrhizus]|uniref:Uncharacterized protein n=1 Tax=Rhizopus oryzae TaxID=64495 RepID=A0A9P6X2M9_RHIOR|nr:hypothetical protein G6F30_010334 [Rhizopus arrhizus]KAG0976866.1 hypothetical protein G6F29_010500 [Rhizopus arrhizus]KAG0986845.1 hypothetical protein G6F28_010151 [Rhizopus arrhizus]KAG1003945.1 hypothetical protein G6F27_010592 [Rhizopus arrhizus]KAG1019062.1 hypothetical protein G6F26_010438 [Rhizopus arrhizus]